MERERRYLPVTAAFEIDDLYTTFEDHVWEEIDSQEVLLSNGLYQRRRGYAHTLGTLQGVCIEESPPGQRPIARCWAQLTNLSGRSVRISRLDSVLTFLPGRGWRALSFSSDWGAEFEPQEQTLGDKELVWESRAGRSSKGMHPFVYFSNGQLSVTVSVAWSGNWIVRAIPTEDGHYVAAGVNDWEFWKELGPGQTVTFPPVLCVFGADSLDKAARQLASFGSLHLYPDNVRSAQMPVEWNHWWLYEDAEINEDTFRRNVDVAAQMGIEAVVLDAGWFGEPGASWYELRGDWDVVNAERFPSGIRALSDYAHEKGLLFGIWCEIEAVGSKARLARERPDLLAMRDGQPLGYICMGNPAAQEWAFGTLDRLVKEYKVDWIKLDFNLDPGAGCNRTDHGHGAGDGLFEHYWGYYRVLERLTTKHPQLLLENCSSGGLRIDLGIMQRTHFTYLSDPDWPVHALQVFWGATTMLAPQACLHWPWSEGRAKPEQAAQQQTFEPRSPSLKQHQLDYYTRINMLSRLGFSLRLPDLPDQVRERLEWHIRLYRTRLRPLLRRAQMWRLFEQPLRPGGGSRWQGFLFLSPQGTEGALFVFRLLGGGPRRTVRLAGLLDDYTYTIEDVDTGRVWSASGEALMEQGIRFTGLPVEGSALLLLS